MALRRYPPWEPPAIDDWEESYPPLDQSRQCLPFAAVAVAAVGAFAFCRPRRWCWPRSCRPRRWCQPRSFCYPYGCAPYLSCSPTYVCYPQTCFPYAV